MELEKFVENVQTICRRMGQSPTVVCRESGAGQTFLSDVKRGKNPTIDRMLKLSSYLGVPLSDLLGDGDGVPHFAPQSVELTAPGGGLLSAEDLELLLAFRSLNADGKRYLLQTAQMCVKSGEYKKAPVSGSIQEGIG